MSLRAKFRCYEVAKVDSGYGKPQERVKLSPVYGSSEKPANAAWSEATPQGQIEMLISNPGAHGVLQVGKEYFVDIHEASE